MNRGVGLMRVAMSMSCRHLSGDRRPVWCLPTCIDVCQPSSAPGGTALTTDVSRDDQPDETAGGWSESAQTTASERARESF